MADPTVDPAAAAGTDSLVVACPVDHVSTAFPAPGSVPARDAARAAARFFRESPSISTRRVSSATRCAATFPW